MRRHHVESTLIRRHFYVMCRLGRDFLDGWMGDFRFYVLFNSFSVISGGWLGDDERLCATEPRLRSVGQRLTYLATGAPGIFRLYEHSLRALFRDVNHISFQHSW